tara:strand:+ start:212 stop:448 length:237 start_codon:yes stop_codon:yes gene_type:complete
MKKILNKWLIPVCLLGIVVIQLVEYYLQKEINTALLVIVFALFPAALKGLDYQISKKIEWIFTTLAVLLLVFTLWYTM